MGCVHGVSRSHPQHHGLQAGAQMELPDYYRPTFRGLDLTRITSREELDVALFAAKKEYNKFLNERLLVAQRAWLSNTRRRGFDVESADAFSTCPCINHPSHQLEQIETTEKAGIREVSRLLYIYMPRDAARQCQSAQMVDRIPDYMCFMDHDRQRKFLAADISPYSIYTSKSAMVARYHSVGCGSVTENDIAFCIVIAETDWTQHDTSKCLYKRSRFGSVDVLAVAPVLFPPEESSSEETD